MEALAELTLDAYRGTIDYQGEDLQAARNDVQAYLDGEPKAPLLDCSWTCWAGETLVSACLIRWWDALDVPLVADIMTRADWKRRGLATALLRRTLHSLSARGYGEVCAHITEGNTASERVFIHERFAKV